MDAGHLSTGREFSESAAWRRFSGVGFLAGPVAPPGEEDLVRSVWMKKDSPWKETERLRVVVHKPAPALVEGGTMVGPLEGRDRSTERERDWGNVGGVEERGAFKSGEGCRRDVELEVELEE